MKSTKQRSIFNNLFRRLTSSRGHAFIVLSALDADIVKSYAELGLGVVVLLTVAFESDRELRAINVAHQFQPTTFHIVLRQGKYLLGYMYNSIERLTPKWNRRAIDAAIRLNAGEPHST